MEPEQTNKTTVILVLERGYIQVCEIEGRAWDYGIWLSYTNARIIRRWGTTQGLAELQNGPTRETVLDAIEASGEVPVRAIIKVINVDQEAWHPHLHPQPVPLSNKRGKKAVSR